MNMDITGKNIWQQACGDKDRNYADLCLKWDVILNGPGSAGKWPDCKKTLKEHSVSPKKIADVKRFADKIKDGDLVVLRLGTTDILGVGIVIGEYTWLDEFSDVDGWDLQHVRRVKWLWNGLKNPKKFPVYTLKQGDTTQILNSDRVLDWLTNLSIQKNAFERALAELPHTNKSRVSHEQISEYLYDRGISSNSIENLLKEIDELTRIAKWYKKFGNPSEFETVAYLVVPLLRALGWTPQKMAIEWAKVDLALFNRLPRTDENLCVVVEAKKKDSSCLTAKSQAEAYAVGKEACKRLIVTDGLRYGVYCKGKNIFILTAYMNLTDLKEEYPIYNCLGAKEALRAMTPEWDALKT